MGRPRNDKRIAAAGRPRNDKRIAAAGRPRNDRKYISRVNFNLGKPIIISAVFVLQSVFKFWKRRKEFSHIIFLEAG